jgi:hypothetical protein
MCIVASKLLSDLITSIDKQKILKIRETHNVQCEARARDVTCTPYIKYTNYRTPKQSPRVVSQRRVGRKAFPTWILVSSLHVPPHPRVLDLQPKGYSNMSVEI